MAATVEFYERVLPAFPDSEGLTVLVVSGVTRDAVLAGLGVDVSRPAEDGWDFDHGSAAWAAVEIPGGVLAVELSGFGDPSLDALASLSEAGAAAVVRSNILAHYRFGAARAGELVFDDDEFIYLSDPDRVPVELRPLFDAAWVDLEGEDENDWVNPWVAGLAMAELVTGVELTEDQVAAVLESDFFLAPSLRYPDVEVAEAEPAGLARVKLDKGVRKLGPQLLWTDGSYMLISSWDYCFEQEALPDDAPQGFGLTVLDHTAWVRTLIQPPPPVESETATQVSLNVLEAQAKPTRTLESLRAAYPHEASGVVVARVMGFPRNGLEAYGNEYNNGGRAVTDNEGTFNLHVFARPRVVGETFDEEHVLLVWPATPT